MPCEMGLCCSNNNCVGVEADKEAVLFGVWKTAAIIEFEPLWPSGVSGTL